MKSYTRLYTSELPSIKPDTPYLILADGTTILQGFGVVAKFDSADQAEEFCKTSKSFGKWETCLAERRLDENFERFMESCKKKTL